jgi:hypothetical protein
MNIKPVTGSKNPADIAADLRDIADLIEDNPHLAAMIGQAFERTLWPMHAAAYEHKDDNRSVMAETIRQLMPIATGVIEKHYDSDFFDATVPLRAMLLRLTDRREAVCTRVVTGVETIVEKVPDPDYIAAAPKITKTRKVETVTWRCEPIMAAAPGEGDSK